MSGLGEALGVRQGARLKGWNRFKPSRIVTNQDGGTDEREGGGVRTFGFRSEPPPRGSVIGSPRTVDPDR